MTQEQFDQFAEEHKYIEYNFDPDEKVCYFKNVNLPIYQDGQAIKLTQEEFKQITPEQLFNVINKGYNVDHISRITGYMSKISGWNSSKKQELKDRVRHKTWR